MEPVSRRESLAPAALTRAASVVRRLADGTAGYDGAIHRCAVAIVADGAHPAHLLVLWVFLCYRLAGLLTDDLDAALWHIHGTGCHLPAPVALVLFAMLHHGGHTAAAPPRALSGAAPFWASLPAEWPREGLLSQAAVRDNDGDKGERFHTISTRKQTAKIARTTSCSWPPCSPSHGYPPLVCCTPPLRLVAVGAWSSCVKGRLPQAALLANWPFIIVS